MKKLKMARAGYLLMSAVFYISGALYMILPDVSPLGICITSGIVLIVYGIIKIIGYFSKDLYCLAFQYDLACGLFLMVLGTIVLSCSQRASSPIYPPAWARWCCWTASFPSRCQRTPGNSDWRPGA